MKIKFIHLTDGHVITPDNCKVSENQNMPGFAAVETETGMIYYSMSALKFIVTERSEDD